MIRDENAHALGPLNVGRFVWILSNRPFVTIVVKATYWLRHDRRMERSEPLPLFERDILADAGDTSPVWPSDVAPYRGRADVVLRGHVHGDPSAPSQRRVRVELRGAGGESLVDKSILAIGDRSAVGELPRPFSRLPISYALAWRDRDNPIGVSGPAFANFQSDDGSRRSVGFGAMAAHWPSRRALLSASMVESLARRIPQLGAGFAWRYFQAAPADQQTRYLFGGEVLTLEGLCPSRAVLRSSLPQSRPVVWVWSARRGPATAVVVPVNADGLQIDTDAERCAVVWRGVMPLETLDAVDDLTIAACVVEPGEDVASYWSSGLPTIARRATTRAATTVLTPDARPGGNARDPLGATLAIAPDDLARPVLPFRDDNSAVSVARAGDLSASRSTEAEPATAPAPLPAPAPPPPPSAVPARDRLAGTLGVSWDRAGDLQAPFPIAPPRTTAPPLIAIPGAPWAAPGAARMMAAPVVSDPLASTLALTPDVQSSPTEEPASPLHGARTSATVEVVSDDDALSAATLVWSRTPRKYSLTIIVKGTFELRRSGPAVLRDEAAPLQGDVRVDPDDPASSLAYASDFAIEKPRADVTLVGSARAAKDEPTAMMVVRFQFGAEAFDRTIRVFGDRVLEPTAHRYRAPQPFTRMALQWENAVQDPQNPVGRSTRAPTTPAKVALPNLETTEQSQSDSTAICFAPIDASWPPRRVRLGTFDDGWLADRWPFFPADFDPAFFQSAPREQQVDRIRGDEPYRLEGLVTGEPVFEGRLPGVRARAFLQRSNAGGEGFSEVPLVLDTVHFDTDAATVTLVWRAVVATADVRASDLTALYVRHEPLSGPSLPLESIHQDYLRTRRAREAPEASVVEPPEPVTHTTAEALAKRRRVEQAVASGASLSGMHLERADLSRMNLSGVDLSRARLQGANLVGARLEEARLTQANLSRADLSDASLVGAHCDRADFAFCKLNNANLKRATLDRADLEGVVGHAAKLDAASAVDAKFIGADLTKATFTNAILTTADMSKATLEGAVFDDATAADLRLYDARGAGASFKRCDLTDVRADASSFPKACFDHARGVSGIWEGATLESATFQAAVLDGASFAASRASGADFSGARLRGARLKGARLARSKLVRADLMRANLRAADLTEADLSGANLFAVETYESTLENARLDGAHVAGSKLATPG
ncbi:MAG: DUF2169 domain-containing protein [Polyangiaceae bacterium]